MKRSQSTKGSRSNTWARASSKLARRLYRAESQVVRLQFELGQFVNRAIAQGRSQGAGIVIGIAKATRFDRTTLYRYATVARMVGESEVEAVVSAVPPVSWSHVVELSRISSPRVRKRMITELLASRLSVRALRRRINALPDAHRRR